MLSLKPRGGMLLGNCSSRPGILVLLGRIISISMDLEVVGGYSPAAAISLFVFGCTFVYVNFWYILSPKLGSIMLKTGLNFSGLGLRHVPDVTSLLSPP